MGAEALRQSTGRARTLRTRHRTFDVPVRESARSKRLRVTVGPDHPLEVVVPVGTRDRVIDRFLREQRAWIARNVAAAERVAAEPGRLGLEPAGGDVPARRPCSGDARPQPPAFRAPDPRARRRGRNAAAGSGRDRAALPQAGPGRGHRDRRARGRPARARVQDDRDRRPAHALGFVLAARAAVVLMAPRCSLHARCSTTWSSTSSATCAIHTTGARSGDGRGGMSRLPRARAVAARARPGAAALPAGPLESLRSGSPPRSF